MPKAASSAHPRGRTQSGDFLPRQTTSSSLVLKTLWGAICWLQLNSTFRHQPGFALRLLRSHKPQEKTKETKIPHHSGPPPKSLPEKGEAATGTLERSCCCWLCFCRRYATSFHRALFSLRETRERTESFAWLALDKAFQFPQQHLGSHTSTSAQNTRVNSFYMHSGVPLRCLWVCLKTEGNTRVFI